MPVSQEQPHGLAPQIWSLRTLLLEFFEVVSMEDYPECPIIKTTLQGTRRLVRVKIDMHRVSKLLPEARYCRRRNRTITTVGENAMDQHRSKRQEDQSITTAGGLSSVPNLGYPCQVNKCRT